MEDSTANSENIAESMAIDAAEIHKAAMKALAPDSGIDLILDSLKIIANKSEAVADYLVGDNKELSNKAWGEPESA